MKLRFNKYKGKYTKQYCYYFLYNGDLENMIRRKHKRVSLRVIKTIYKLARKTNV